MVLVQQIPGVLGIESSRYSVKTDPTCMLVRVGDVVGQWQSLLRLEEVAFDQELRFDSTHVQRLLLLLRQRMLMQGQLMLQCPCDFQVKSVTSLRAKP